MFFCAQHWLEDEDRRQYAATAYFYSDEECPGDIYNLHGGMDVERWPALSVEERADPAIASEVAFLWSHLRTLVDNDDHVESWKNWLAHIFQFPSTKTRLCRVLHSTRQGVGKNLFEEVFKAMLGPRLYCFSSKPEEELLGKFTSVLQGRLLVVINESSISSKSCIEIFKDLIVAPVINVRAMRENLFERPCRANFLITTNNDAFTSLSDNERRYEFSSSDADRMSPDRAKRLAAIQTNRRVLRAVYEELVARPMTRDYDFASHRVQSRVYTNLVESSRPIQIRFFGEWLSQLSMPRQTSTSFVLPAAAVSTEPPPFDPDYVYTLSLGEMYDAYRTWADNCGLLQGSRVFDTRDQFTTRLVSLLEVKRGSVEPGESGVAYFKQVRRTVVSAVSGERLEQKAAWAIHVAKARAFLDKRYAGGGV